MDWLSKVPPWLAALALVAIAGAFVFIAVKQPKHFRFAGLDFGRVQQADLSLDEAVIAFNLGKDSECPNGWKPFQPASGRMIVGAEPSDYPSYSDEEEKAVGGEKQVTLTVEQIPKHTHELIEDSAQTTGYLKAGEQRDGISSQVGNATHDRAMEVGDQAHNNMPPYIALYFCKKD